MQLPAFPRPQRPCHDLVHVGFHVTNRLRKQPIMENLFIQNVLGAPPEAVRPRQRELSEWKRH